MSFRDNQSLVSTFCYAKDGRGTFLALSQISRRCDFLNPGWIIFEYEPLTAHVGLVRSGSPRGARSVLLVPNCTMLVLNMLVSWNSAGSLASTGRLVDRW